MSEYTEPSKSQRKRDMHALRDLGKTLTELSEDQLARLQLPDALRDAIREVRHISQRGALRRQLQYVGKLMREVDAERVQRELDAMTAGSLRQTAILHQSERWRERLLADEATVSEFVSSYPQCDVQKLRALVRNSRRESVAGKPPRAFRELLRLIRHLLVANGTTDETDGTGHANRQEEQG